MRLLHTTFAMRLRILQCSPWSIIQRQRVERPTSTTCTSSRTSKRGSQLSAGSFLFHTSACHQKNRPPEGGRPLTDKKHVFEYNNWDNVEWDVEQEEEAKAKVKNNSATIVDKEKQKKYDADADSFWDQFYNQHQNRFFKDRHWLFTEFPELAPVDATTVPSADSKEMLCEKTNKHSERELLGTSGASVQELAADLRVLLQPQPQSMPDNQRILVQGIQGDSVELAEARAVQLVYESQQNDDTLGDSESTIMQGLQGDVELADSTVTDSLFTRREQQKEKTFKGHEATKRILEVGCGVGNTIFPVLQTNIDPGLFMYGCDLSDTAVQIVKEHVDYDEKRCHAFVCDVTNPAQPFPFPPESLDIVIMIFVLSAIHPDKMQSTISRLANYVKPGGMIVFRDYGRYDLTQLRFKDGQCLSTNFYVRGDGTRVYFFTQDELREMFTTAGMTEELQNYVDRRLQVNRGRQIKMYRVWVQCKYRKPIAGNQ